jgi:dihydroneopterin aldolase
LEDTVDYRQAIERVQQLVRSTKFALVERLSEAIAEAVLALAGVTQVRVRLTKEAPPIPDFGGQIVIDILRPQSSGLERGS